VFALDYHVQTKHHFQRFARSPGYLDWATLPDPFRRYAGAPLVSLPRTPIADAVPYPALFDGRVDAAPLSRHSIGEFLRCSMGLSAWKQYGASRWALRVNPSSGNLHPTEAYVLAEARLWHYASREHALEERCVLDESAWAGWMHSAPGESGFLVALTSIHWREAWKYGERAFRYCQHDAGHAIAALRLAAALLGWRLALLPWWAEAQLATLLGLHRDADFADAEREEAECLAVVTPGDPASWIDRDPAPLVDSAACGSWCGTASRLSCSRVEWPMIDAVAAATRCPGSGIREPGSGIRSAGLGASHCGTLAPSNAPHPRTLAPSNAPPHPHAPAPSHIPAPAPSHIPSPAPAHQVGLSARAVILQRRSALAFDGESGLGRDAFWAMLRRLQPPGPPWDAIDWPPQVHLALFVHRVEGVDPGLYAYLRDPTVLDEWKAMMRSEFLWEPVHPEPVNPNPSTQAPKHDELFLLAPFDCRRLANRVSCDQKIAADGFFSLGMIARVEPALHERGEWFYRRLYWECGLIGQVLYLEAETTGGRATGIGCFYDDPVHDLLGLAGPRWQSLYHFSMGVPVDDARLTTEPGYPWERP
jgi:SagB-type dehydrogenase family enzyme